MNRFFASVLTRVLVFSLVLLFPFLPLLATLVFWRLDFSKQYLHTLKKIWCHLQALREGPAQHYFADVMGRASQVPEAMGGSCVQCGNCCMHRRCMFLVSVDSEQYQCGIYHSRWRKYSNCGSFPLHANDIERYECPSYFVIPIALVQ